MIENSENVNPIIGIPYEKIPRHIAIIMDGNGRWAQAQGKPRLKGHAAGSNSVRKTIVDCADLGIEALTLYSFSTENWRRPKEEIAGLMQLYAKYLVEERPTIMSKNIRVRHVGLEDNLPDFVLKELHETIRMSKDNTGMTFCLALNYSGRAELICAFKKIAAEIKSGELDVSQIDEQLISDHLDTAGLPDPDLLIRTSGEMRISNYLLWQIAYAEFYVTDIHWPDFNTEALHEAIREYSTRNRRFGGLAK